MSNHAPSATPAGTTARSPVTTHVLDVSLGRPARGIAVRLAKQTSAGWSELGRGETDADGRASQLLAPGTLEAGTHRISFELEPYFAASGRKSFYPSVDIVFVVENASEHFHVPLLLSPFGYSTYRGS
jgi:5-hydroxyisourate hydrolase